jgi:rhodanese-related sulfurtransferase
MGLFDFFRGAGSSTEDVIAHDELSDALKQKSCILIDVREPNEFASGRVPGSTNHPLSRFDPTKLPKEKPVVLICRSGMRSGQALAKARAQGRSDIRHYRGGVMGWASAGGKLV